MIAANAITATKIATGVITGDKISANTITGGLIAASGIITSSAQINNAVVTNAQIGNLAVDTIKVANDAITRQEFTAFSTQSGSGPYSFTFNTSMTFAGSIIAIATVQMFGTSSSSSSRTFTLTLAGSQKVGVNIGGSHCLGLHTMSGGDDFTSTGTKSIVVTVSSISGVGNPSAKCQLTVLRRFK